MDSLVHNRGWMHVAGVLAAVVLLGASCSQKETPTPTPQPTTDAGTTAMPTEWTEYRNPAFGVVIPYPKGWYVEEGAEGTAVSFYPAQPPPESDAPPLLWFDRLDMSTAEFVRQLDNIESDSTVERVGIRMRRIVRRDDISDVNGLAVSYLWEEGGVTYRLGGRQGDPKLEWMVDHLEVLP